MANEPSLDEIARWDRWFAVEMNNRGWELAEQAERTPEETEEMLHAAHAAAMHWARVGTDMNRARADMLLGQAHALSGNASLALLYSRRSCEYLTAHDTPAWEIASVHAILANAAHIAGDRALYAEQHVLAKRCGKGISDTAEREIFQQTFSRLPPLQIDPPA